VILFCQMYVTEITVICLFPRFCLSLVFPQSETAAAQAEKLNSQVVVDFVPSNIDSNEDGEGTDDLKSIADTVMSESTIRSIHSRKSLAVLVTRARERIIGMMDPIEEGKMPQPNQSTIPSIADDGQKKKFDVYKLPFQNRNPAV